MNEEELQRASDEQISQGALEEQAPPAEQMQGGGGMPAGERASQGGQTPPRTREDIMNDLQAGVDFIDNDLARELAQMVEKDPSLEDLFFENKEEFFKRILEVVGDELENNITSRRDELIAFNNEEAFQNRLGAFEQALSAFAEANPQVDTQKLLEFYTGLPQEVQKQLDSLPPQAMVQRLFELYQQSQSQNQAQGGEPNQAQEQQQDELPQQLNGVPSPTGWLNQDLELPTTKW